MGARVRSRPPSLLRPRLRLRPPPVEEPSPIPEAEDIDVPLPEPVPEPEPEPEPKCQLLGKQGCKSIPRRKLCRRSLCLWAPPAAAALEMPRLPQKRMKKKGGNVCRTPPTRG